MGDMRTPPLPMVTLPLKTSHANSLDGMPFALCMIDTGYFGAFGLAPQGELSKRDIGEGALNEITLTLGAREATAALSRQPWATRAPMLGGFDILLGSHPIGGVGGVTIDRGKKLVRFGRPSFENLAASSVVELPTKALGPNVTWSSTPTDGRVLLVVEVSIDGEVRKLVVDTGASEDVMLLRSGAQSSKPIGQLRIGIVDRAGGTRSLAVDGYESPAEGFPNYRDANIAGVLGWSFLRRFRGISLDYIDARVVLED